MTIGIPTVKFSLRKKDIIHFVILMSVKHIDLLMDMFLECFRIFNRYFWAAASRSYENGGGNNSSPA